jgi:hypothetical protein
MATFRILETKARETLHIAVTNSGSRQSTPALLGSADSHLGTQAIQGTWVAGLARFIASYQSIRLLAARMSSYTSMSLCTCGIPTQTPVTPDTG